MNASLLVRLGVIGALWLIARRRRDSVSAARIDQLVQQDRWRLIYGLSRDKRIPLLSRAVLIAPAAYLISPIDLLPDFIPVLGRLDDSLVFAASIELAALFIPSQIIDQHLDRIAGRSAI
jgi:uncharacterized membrane protein YkvA (DUF1232 family)